MPAKWFGMSLLIAAAMMLGASQAFAGSVCGTVVFEGKAPPMRPISAMEGNPDCAAIHDGDYPKMEWLVLDDSQHVQYVIVRVVEGLPADKSYPVPEDAVILTQKGCMYAPHAFVVRAGQTLTVTNPDAILHNIHAVPEKNTEFNKSTSAQRTQVSVVFDTPEGPFPFKCDVHPWMQAFCLVSDHPYSAVTDEHGKYTIQGLPAGEYTLEFWHERLTPTRKTVTVPEDGAATVDVTFTRPK